MQLPKSLQEKINPSFGTLPRFLSNILKELPSSRMFHGRNISPLAASDVHPHSSEDLSDYYEYIRSLSWSEVLKFERLELLVFPG